MCRLLGVPDDGVATFAGWADALSRTFVPMDAEQIKAAQSAQGELLSYTSDLVDRRGGDPGEDLITELLRVEHEGDKLTRHEVETMVSMLLIAAHDTTASQLGCSLLALLHHPDQVAAIRTGQTAPGDAVTETMRFEPAIPMFSRIALEPIVVGGIERPADTMVILAAGVANRDPDVYPDPDRLDVGRFRWPDVPRPLTFGSGAHYCLGSNLARMVLEETIRGFAERDLRFIGDPGRGEWKMGVGRGPVRLPVEVATLR